MQIQGESLERRFLLATVTVTTANDVLDGDVTSITQLANSPGDDGLISLREAVVATNNTAGADIIEFGTSLNGAPIVLNINTAGTDELETGDLDIVDELILRGNGAGMTIIDATGLDPDGNGPEFGDRVFEITTGNVTIERVTVTGGNSAENGGGILNSGGAVAVRASVISGNRAVFSGGGIASRAKYGNGSFRIEQSTISGNTAGQNGGGVYNFAGTSTAAMTVSNSTISGNTAAASSGGGIANFAKYGSASLDVQNSTISGNTADVAGGGIVNTPFFSNGNATVSILQSTIIANNTAGNGEHDLAQQGTLQTAEFNLIESSAGHTIANGINGNRVGVDPLLGPLQINGGLTPTHALLTGSPAIDAGANPQALANDQRGAGFPRDAGVATDIGAFETGGSLSGVKFDDINGSGRRAVGIQGIGGVTIFLDLNDDGMLNPGEPSTVTSPDGSFQFLNAPAGTYTVREIVPQNTAPPTGPFTVTVGSGTTQSGLEFGNFTLVTLSGTKFLDINENGIQDSGEPPLAGVFIGLDETGPEDNSFSNDRDTRTDGNGHFRFENVGPPPLDNDGNPLQVGVFEIAPPGFQQVAPANPALYAFSLLSGGNRTDLNFANALRVAARKSDSLSVDPDEDGMADVGDRIKYSITIVNNDNQALSNGVFSDSPGVSTRLISGSVTSSAGSITTGNGTGDSQISINLSTVAPQAQVTIMFEVEVIEASDLYSNQGAIGWSLSPSERFILLTDDPDVPGLQDPTVTPGDTTLPCSLIVTTTMDIADTGDAINSLREAILCANSRPGFDTISFEIPGVGPHTIQPASELPDITDSVLIDGYTQTGAVLNTNPLAVGLNTILMVELDGSGSGPIASGLRLVAGSEGSTIRGLAINRFPASGIEIVATAGSSTISGNFLGTNLAGTAALGNGAHGVFVLNAPGNIIGGDLATNPALANLISGNDVAGVSLRDNASANEVLGNMIGLNAAGTATLSNQKYGVGIYNGQGNRVGRVTDSPGTGPGNIISGNTESGVEIDSGTSSNTPSRNNSVQGNVIGLGSDGFTALGNQMHGVSILNSADNSIGGSSARDGNVIASNAFDGVHVETEEPEILDILEVAQSTGNLIQNNRIGTARVGTTERGNTGSGVVVINSSNNRVLDNIIAFNSTLADRTGVVVNGSVGVVILTNSIFSNDGLGINLVGGSEDSFGVTDNDTQDGDAGSNNLQNYPVLTSAVNGLTTTTVSGTFNSLANRTFRIEFFANTQEDPSEFGEGEVFLTATTVLTNGSGSFALNVPIAPQVPVGRFITATATLLDSEGAAVETSEFSNAVLVEGQVADLELSKIVDDTTPDSGNQVTFTVTLTNRGPNPATNVQVRDVLPAGLTLVSATPPAGTTFAEGLWQIPNLSIATGSNTSTLTIVATVNSSGTSITNTAAVVASDQSDPDSTPDNNVSTEDDQASVTLTVAGAADLELSKIANDTTPGSGDQVTFTVMLTNRGPNPATNVQVRDVLPAGLTLVSATPPAGTTFAEGLWQVPNLAIATGTNSATLTIVATVIASGTSITNTTAVVASDQSDPDSTPNNNVGTEDDQASVTLTVAGAADLELSKIVSDTTPDSGDQVSFTVTLTNRGPNPATNVQVRDVLPAGMTLVSATPQAGTTFAEGLWQVPNLAIATGTNSATLTIVATVTASGTSITNTAAVVASDQSDPDSTPNNNVGAEDDQASVTLTVAGAADLELSKIVNDSTPDLGDQVTFTVTLTNRGPNPATNVQVRDVLPAGLTLVSATPPTGTTIADGVWQIPGLANTTGSNTATLTIVATVTVAGTPITNTAEVIANDQADPDSTPGNSAGGEDDLATATVQASATIGTINGVKFEDINGDGIRNSGQQQFSEPGLSGVVVYLDTNNNGVLDVDMNNSPIEPFTTTRVDDPATTSVNEQGTYTLTDVPPGSHSVCEVIPAGFSQTFPGGENRCHTVHIGDGGSVNNVDFGNRQLIGDDNSIAGFVYLDVNNNGVKDPAEISLPNVPVTVSGPVTRTITTATNGSYRFADLPSGTYSITETQPAAFLDGLDSQGSPLLGSVENDRFVQLTLTGGINAVNYNLGERGLAPQFLSKALLLASTPSPHQLAPRFVPLPTGNTGDAVGPEGEFAVFTAPTTGILTIRTASKTDPVPPIEIYSSARMPIVISNDGSDIRVPVSAKQSYLLYAPEGETAGLEFHLEATSTNEASRPFASNPANPLDTNRDGSVTPLDALAVINWLNGPGRRESIQSEVALDSTGDGHVSSRDALVVINFLTRQQATVEGEPRASRRTFASREFVFFGPREPEDQTLPPSNRSWVEAIDEFFAEQICIR